jgi:hypothetical protein
MNVFYLDRDPITSAQMHCDKHVVKMIVEYAQILSTAHRMLDGVKLRQPSVSGKTMVNYWAHPEEWKEVLLYKACHFNHPSTVWARQTNNNYTWLYCMWWALCKEYTHRYGKVHKTESLKTALMNPPKNIPVGYKTQPPPAMSHYPQCIVEGDSVASYHKYYRAAKKSFARWTNREVPDWFYKGELKET